jgi:hypothetical protein
VRSGQASPASSSPDRVPGVAPIWRPTDQVRLADSTGVHSARPDLSNDARCRAKRRCQTITMNEDQGWQTAPSGAGSRSLRTRAKAVLRHSVWQNRNSYRNLQKMCRWSGGNDREAPELPSSRCETTPSPASEREPTEFPLGERWADHFRRRSQASFQRQHDRWRQH